MRVALAQINPTLGDFSGNRVKIVEYCLKAQQRRCDFVIFPEASLFGYHPVDLLERSSIVEVQLKELKKLEKQIPEGLQVLVGAITKNPKKDGKPFLNAAVLLRKNKKPRIFAKELLPTYDVFDEGRHIEKGDVTKNIIKHKGQRILVTICEDIWAWPLKKNQGSNYKNNPLKKLKSSEVDVVFNLSASPFTETKIQSRKIVTKATAKHFKAPMIYVNMVGAQDEIIFDGGSFAIDKNGKILAQNIRFGEDINVVDLASGEGGFRENSKDKIDLKRQAIVLGIRDFCEKTGLSHCHLGLSGGIDSALVMTLAVDALGPFNVTGVALPGPYSSEKSLILARELVENLGANIIEASIDPIYEAALQQFNAAMGESPFGVVHENLQSRARCLLLMAYANKENSLLLNTSNKSELATGYSTLYGDHAGGLSVVGDLLKTEVYEMARHYNAQSEVIPEGIISRAPSAELRPNQTDQDTLPPYAELDPAVEKLVENCRSPRTELDKKVLSMMMKSEFKRWQAPPIIKVTDHAFGRGRRLPVAHKAIY